MVQVKNWSRSVLALLVLSSVAFGVLQGADGHTPVKIAGDNPKIFTGG